MKACKNCHRLVDKVVVDEKKGKDAKGTDDNICPVCSSPTSKTWQGYVIINDPKKSRIAQKMSITSQGKYALKVR